jgi:hypothetical protein
VGQFRGGLFPDPRLSARAVFRLGFRADLLGDDGGDSCSA